MTSIHRQRPGSFGRHRRLPGSRVFLTALLHAVSAVVLHAAPPSGAGWNLAWNDEFNGTSLDTSKWGYWLPGARRDAVNSPSAVSVSGGTLKISTYTSGGTHYTGMISTQNTYPYTYGYVEARIDYGDSPGMWSAFWMQSPTMGNPIGSPNTAGTEIDICEHRAIDGSGTNISDLVVGNIHWDGYGTNHKSTGYTSPSLSLSNSFHIYGMEWTPTQQKFYIDGVLRWTVNNGTNSPVSQRSEFIILSSEVDDTSTTWAGSIPAGGYGSLSATTTKMTVDYVRVYRRAETVVNGDFEGNIGPFSTTNQASWSSTGGHTAPAAAKIAPTSGASSAEQTVRGLLPDTGYILTAWGNAGSVSPGLFMGAKNFGGSQTGQTLTSATYAQATVPFTTGSANRTAALFAYSSNIGSTGYADDFLLRRAATVTNGQLETGDSLAWNSVYGGAVVSSDNTYGGAYAWKIPASGASAGVEQEVAGLTPNTAYRLSGWTTNGGGGLGFGVKNHGSSQVLSTVSASTWTRATVNFTTGAANTTATIFAYRASSSQTSYADAFFLYQPLAAPWTSADVSTPTLSGIAGSLGDRFVIQSAGANLGGAADHMHFLDQPVSGDATITARILGADTTAYYAKTGVMIRESTAAGARSASVAWGPVNQLAEFSYRSATNGSAGSADTVREITDPPWVRLTRRNNIFTAWYSPDGASWTRMGTPQTISMTANALAGICTCSGDESRLVEAELDNVSVGPPVPDVSITSPSDGVTIPVNGGNLGLTATVADSGTPVILWSMVGGPGTVSFANPAAAVTAATFSAAGTYQLRCVATNAAGTGSADLTVNVAPATTVDPSLVLRLKLDESSGTTAADSSGSGNNGTAVGGVSWQPAGGVLTGAADFNGADSYISVPDNANLDGTSAFTLSYWFTANTLNGAGLVAKRVNFNDNNSYGTFLTADGKLNVDIDTNNDRFTSAATFSTGAWYHVALVFDGGQAAAQRAKLYVNGVLDTTATETSASLPNYNSPLCVGILSTPTTAWFDGLIDEVRFYRRALSAAEIAGIVNETATYAPEVSTGPAPAAVAGVAAPLAGSVATAGGNSPVSAWTMLSGPGSATFGNAASPSTTVTFGLPGTYVLRLTATNANARTFADLSVTVTQPQPVVSIVDPSAPVALANVADVLRIAASVDSNGVADAPVVSWSKSSGPGEVTFADSSGAVTTAGFSSSGSYILRCTATTSGGSASADLSVAVAAPASLSFREGDGGYNHVGTFIRADSTAWNSGARDQMLVGRGNGSYPFRTLFSFPLTGVPTNATLASATLELWTDATTGAGTVGTLELRDLTATPVEGNGNSSSDSNIGAGSGATWINRTQTVPWSLPGGDFGSTVLSSVPGFAATATNSHKTFASTAAFLASAQAALSAGQPLSLMLLSPLTESGANNNYTRISSDDSLLTAQRPRLTLGWVVNPAPVIDPGTAPAAITGVAAMLTASVTGAAASTWSLISGPGAVAFGNPAQPATTVTFSASGSYLLRLTASNSHGAVSRTLAVEVSLNPAVFSDWQKLTWPGVSDTNITGADMDPDHDGLSNLLEWALALDATRPDAFLPSLVKSGVVLEYTYTRRKSAQAVYQTEWSDTLGGDWSASGVLPGSPVSLGDTTEQVTDTVPSGSAGGRFVRLRVTGP